MSIHKVALKKDSLTPEGLEAAAQAKRLADLKASFPNQTDAELREKLPKPVHTCDLPKVTTADNLGPGSIYTCDTCGRQKELVYFSHLNPWDDSDDSRWAWRNLAHAPDKPHGRWGNA